MSGLGEMFLAFFGSKPTKKNVSAGVKRPQVVTGVVRSSNSKQKTVSPKVPKQALVEFLHDNSSRAPIPYWILRGWRRKADCIYLGYFKTRVGRCHGVIKWHSEYDFGVYVHDVPRAILHGVHGQCFSEVKSRKFRVHFAEYPKNLNSVIFYVECLLQEGFEK